MHDRYTKTVLTVIAVALCFDVAMRTVKPAYAAPPGAAAPTGIMRVAICDPTNPKVCADIFTKQMPNYNGTGIVMENRAGLGVFQQ